MNKKISIFDTTLRDGEQTEGISFTIADKVKIAKMLDDLGVDYIEGGWPAANPKAMEFFHQIKKEKLKHAEMVAFGATAHPKNKAADDPNLQGLIESEAPVVCIFGKTWDLHVREALGISLEKNLEIVTDSIKFLKSKKKKVFFDAEHFFDGYKANKEYALKVIQTADQAGADVVVLCDTNGGTLFTEFEKIIEQVKKNISCEFGIHCHNDSDLAVANSLMAVKLGATQVQGTINGIGERCGNANLISIIANLNLKMDLPVIDKNKLKKLTDVSHRVSEIANWHPNAQQAFVGKSAFTHKGGIHVSAIQKNRLTYEHIDPTLVGNIQRVVVSDMSGTSNLIYKAQEKGFELPKDDPRTKELLKEIKELEKQGYQFEEGEASFEILVKKTFGKHKPLFELGRFQTTSLNDGKDKTLVEASIHLKINDEEIHTVGSGNGPVAALDGALRKALEKHFPKIKNIYLTDYKVRVLAGHDGTSALVRVLIESSDGEKTWGTVGVSTNIIEASYQALVDSFEYYLLK